MSTHKRLASSGAPRWIRCNGSIAYIEWLIAEGKIRDPKIEEPNKAGVLGTAVHSIIEYCLENEIHPLDLTKSIIKKIIKSNAETKDVIIGHHDLNGAVRAYDFVEDISPEYDVMFAEKKYDLSFIYDAEVGGTADISLLKKRGLGHIADYKNGRGVVEASSYQLKMYLLGLYHNHNKKYKFKKFKATVIQPNAKHLEGPIRTEDISLKDLLKFEEKKVIPSIEAIKNKSASLTPGPIQCDWCLARHVCEANATQSLAVAQIDFKNIGKPQAELPMPTMLSKDQLAFVLDNTKRLRNFLDQCSKYADELVRSGEEVGDYELHDKWSNRQLLDKRVLRKQFRKRGIRLKELQVQAEPKMMNLTQIQQLLRSKGMSTPEVKVFMDDVTTTHITGSELVKVSKSIAERDFSEQTKKPIKRKKRKVKK